MKRGVLIGLGAVVLFALVLAFLPARLLPRLLPPDAIRLSALSGTLLKGRAARAIVPTPAGYIHLGSLSWEIDPFSLLTLAPRVAIRSAWGAQRASLTLRRRGARIEIDDLDATIDATLLRTLAPLAVDGRLSLQFEHLVFEGTAPSAANGRFVWQDAVWRTKTREHPLGSYVAQVSSTGATILAEIDTLAGPVEAQGNATLEGSGYDLEISIAALNGSLAAEVERALQLFATPDEDGYLLRLDGDLALAP